MDSSRSSFSSDEFSRFMRMTGIHRITFVTYHHLLTFSRKESTDTEKWSETDAQWEMKKERLA